MKSQSYVNPCCSAVAGRGVWKAWLWGTRLGAWQWCFQLFQARRSHLCQRSGPRHRENAVCGLFKNHRRPVSPFLCFRWFSVPRWDWAEHASSGPQFLNAVPFFAAGWATASQGSKASSTSWRKESTTTAAAGAAQSSSCHYSPYWAWVPHRALQSPQSAVN